MNDWLKTDPDDSHSCDDLIAIFNAHDGELQRFERKSAEHAWFMGRALSLAKQKWPGKWKDFLMERSISVSTDWRLRRLAFCFSTVADISGLTITEAYEKVGCFKRPSNS